MSQVKRARMIESFLVLSGLSLAALGCGSTQSTGLSLGSAVEPPFEEARAYLSVTSAPTGAEVWVGPGSIEGSVVGTARESARLLGRTPLRERLAAADTSLGGDLEFSVRHQAVRRDGRIAHASRVIQTGGTFRVHADLHSTLTDQK